MSRIESHGLGTLHPCRETNGTPPANMVRLAELRKVLISGREDLWHVRERKVGAGWLGSVGGGSIECANGVIVGAISE